MWDLIIEGIVRPALNDGLNDKLARFHVTDYGKEKLQDPNTPYDPDGYLKRLNRSRPRLLIRSFARTPRRVFSIPSVLGGLLSSNYRPWLCVREGVPALGQGLRRCALRTSQTKFRQNTDGVNSSKRQFDEFGKQPGQQFAGQKLPG